MKRRVVVTGVGAISPLGNTIADTWNGIISGYSGAGHIEQFDASSWPVRIACEVKKFELDSQAYKNCDRGLMNRPCEFGMAAAYEAIEDSGFLSSHSSQRFGVSVGAGIGTIRPGEILRILERYDIQPGFEGVSEYLEKSASQEQGLGLKNHPGMLAAHLAKRWGAQNRIQTHNTACAASSQSIGEALLAIRRGEADVMLAGGADSLAGELLLAGFCLLGVLSQNRGDPKEASRPFDKSRDGFVASEGAAFLVLEEFEKARSRGAKIYCELKGYGHSENAYRITDLPDDARGAKYSMESSMRDAGIGLDEIDYINAHGTSTEQNDRVEALAISDVFYQRGHAPRVSSSKSQIGHLVAASGAIEAAISVKSAEKQMLVPNINLSEQTVNDEIQFVRTSQRADIRNIISNSFGFGGTNSSLIFGRVDA